VFAGTGVGVVGIVFVPELQAEQPISSRAKTSHKKLERFEAWCMLKAPSSCAIASHIIYSCSETHRYYSYACFHPNITIHSVVQAGKTILQALK
jgi:hypothetical protein